MNKQSDKTDESGSVYNTETWECVTSIYYHLIWQIWKLQTLFNWNIILNISKNKEKKENQIEQKNKN